MIRAHRRTHNPTPKPASECPYPGLLRFQRDDRELFFGREDLADELLVRVRERGFVAVVGGSGSGKSSVLRAGVLPAFGPGEAMTPGERPSVPDVAGLLVVDQFEEVFTLCDDDAVRTRFIDGLLAREQPVAIALRADFYGSCANHARLAGAVARDQVLLGPMSADELSSRDHRTGAGGRAARRSRARRCARRRGRRRTWCPSAPRPRAACDVGTTGRSPTDPGRLSRDRRCTRGDRVDGRPRAR